MKIWCNIQLIIIYRLYLYPCKRGRGPISKIVTTLKFQFLGKIGISLGLVLGYLVSKGRTGVKIIQFEILLKTDDDLLSDVVKEGKIN